MLNLPASGSLCLPDEVKPAKKLACLPGPQLLPALSPNLQAQGTSLSLPEVGFCQAHQYS